MKEGYALLDVILKVLSSIEFWSAVVGAVIGGLIIILWDRHKINVEKQEVLRSTLIAINAELQTLWNRYNKTMGVCVEALTENKPIDIYYQVSEKYFTIYDNNANVLGQLSDRDLIENIISVHINAKGFVDAFRLNNMLLSRYLELTLMDMTDRNIFHMHTHAQKSLISMAGQIKAQHEKLKLDISNMEKMLKCAIESGRSL